MKKALMFKIVVISAMLIGMFVPISPVGAESGKSYSFIFVGRNVTMRAWGLPRIYVPKVMDIKPGSYMILVGGGTFNPSTCAVSGGGAFAHFDPDGTLLCIGIWTVESFVSFDSGVLIITAKWTRVWSPIPEYKPMVIGTNFLEISKNGWTVWASINPDFPIFNVIVSGHVLFHQHR